MPLTASVIRKQEQGYVTLEYGLMATPITGFTGFNLGYISGSGVVNRPAVETKTQGAPRDWEADFLGQDVSRFFYKWGGTFSSVMVRLRSRYDGDLDQFLIHLIFMLTELAAVNTANEAKAKGAERVILRRRGLNALSLSDITRIPRESVRRKLGALLDRDLLEREEDGLYYLGPASDLDRFFYDLSPLFWDKARPA